MSHEFTQTHSYECIQTHASQVHTNSSLTETSQTHAYGGHWERSELQVRVSNKMSCKRELHELAQSLQNEAPYSQADLEQQQPQTCAVCHLDPPPRCLECLDGTRVRTGIV